MGLFKKLFKGKFKKLGRQIKSVGKGKFFKGVGKVGQGLFKGIGAVFSSGIVPVPGSGLLGKGFQAVAAIKKKPISKFTGSLFKSGQVFGQGPLPKGRTVETLSSRRRKALPPINRALSSTQRQVLGQPSFIPPERQAAVAKFLEKTRPPLTIIKRGSIGQSIKKAQKRAGVKPISLVTPAHIASVIPKGKLANLNVGTSTGTAKEKPMMGELTTGNKIAIAGLGLSAILLLARVIK